MRILIAVDGSPYSNAALDEVSRRTWPKGSEILIVHAFDPLLDLPSHAWTVPADYYHRIIPAAHKQANSIIDAAVQKLKSGLRDTVEIRGKAVLSSPKRVILDEAENFKADLIVVGSHGYPTWERLLLGSVSQAVVSHAQCSVEVVRLPVAKQLAA